jgi:hypothetical protein
LSIKSYITTKEPVMAAALASGAIGLALKFGWHPSTTVLAVLGAVTSVGLAFLARSKVTPASDVMKAILEAIDKGLQVTTTPTGEVVLVNPEPSSAGEAAIGGAVGGAAGAAAGAAVGGAVGSVVGAVTGGLKEVLGALRFNKRKREKP